MNISTRESEEIREERERRKYEIGKGGNRRRRRGENMRLEREEIGEEERGENMRLEREGKWALQALLPRDMGHGRVLGMGGG